MMWETEGRDEMRTREDAIRYGLTFDGAYTDRPFPRADWQLVRVRGSKKGQRRRSGPAGYADRFWPSSQMKRCR